ncbi:MAG TPA: HdeD family acid-resistance protein [Ignavibacteria bacterium]|nr:HdeD family acid-resistance protein [Ignavibacteria bacterium]HMR40400.1 HdeD family acid-resistance protein [Ignavibacteria bacterium]
MLEKIQKKWWLVLLRGILAVIFGIIALVSPGIVLISLLFYFGFVALFSGIFLIIEGIAVKDDDRGIRIMEGILSLIFGILFIAMPGFVISFVMYFIAFWAIIGGIMQIIYAIKLRKEITNEWMAVFNGVITLIFGILVLTNIFAGASTLVMLFGIFALISGFLLIGLSFKVKSVGKS